MALVPEFISILRKIRDVIYPEINELYDNSVTLKEQIDVGLVSFNEDFAQFETDYNAFNVSKNQVDSAVTQASAYANQASQSATIATNKSNEIKAITAQSQTGAPGTLASASYNPTDGKFTFIIPQGAKGDKGESFTVNSSGTTAQRALYDAQPAGWSFLDLTTSTLYFKVSNTSGDWSIGVPFGKGDTGDTGATGIGIQSFTFVSTTDISGLPAQNGATDTYRVTLTDASTFDYQVYNGLDASLTYVDEQVALVQADVDNLITDFTNHIPMANYVPYNLLEGDLSVDNTVLTNGFGLYLYTGNTTTQPTINLGMDLESQWGDNANETYGYLIKIKSRNATSDWTWVNSVRGSTKYISSNTTAAEGTDANMFTLSTVAGVTTLNIGTSTRTNTNGVTYVIEVYQTTHKKTGVTNQGKAFTEHYNPDTGFTIEGFEGSGLAGHEIPHSLDRKLGIYHIKNTSTTATDWFCQYQANETVFLKSNLTDAVASGAISTFNTNSIVLNPITLPINQASQNYLLIGWRNSYFDESGKLIGNFEIGVYQGNGVAGNKVTTRGKLALFAPKRLDTTGNWLTIDNQRNYKALYTNVNIAESIASDGAFYTDGFVFTDASDIFSANTSGGQYLYFGVYDNDNGSGKSKYYKATDNANVQINNALIPLAKGIDSNGVKNEIIIANETITGVTWEEGKNYPYRTTTGYGKSVHRPRYLKSELIRTYAGEQPEYFDVEKNKWFSCDTGSELVTNGTFSDGTTTGWTAQDGAVLSIDNGTLKVLNGIANGGSAYQLISGLTIGKKYKIKAKDVGGNTNYSSIFLAYNAPTLANAIYITGGSSGGTLSTLTVDTEFIAQATSVYVVLRNEITTVNLYNNFDNISVFPIEITPTTEITESRNYMNHIVHADSQGNPLFVEELPKIKYENLIVQGENRKVIEIGTIYNNNRYVVENPFGNEKYMDCDVRVEILYNGKWGEAGWDGNAGTGSAAYGTKSFLLNDGIVIQTGTLAIIAGDANVVGHPFGSIATQTSAPARVIVTYVGVAK